MPLPLQYTPYLGNRTHPPSSVMGMVRRVAGYAIIFALLLTYGFDIHGPETRLDMALARSLFFCPPAARAAPGGGGGGGGGGQTTPHLPCTRAFQRGEVSHNRSLWGLLFATPVPLVVIFALCNWEYLAPSNLKSACAPRMSLDHRLRETIDGCLFL